MTSRGAGRQISSPMPTCRQRRTTTATSTKTALVGHPGIGWFAPEDLKIGDRFQERIEESIRVHDKLLLVLSENSVVSPWVEREVQAAFEREHRSGKPVLFPIRVDEAVMKATQAWAADIRRTRHIGETTTRIRRLWSGCCEI